MPAIHPDITFVPAVQIDDLSDGASAGDWVSMKNWGHCDIVIMIGETAGATCAVTLDQATLVDGTGSKTLSFSTYYRTGFRLDYDGASGSFTVGETVTGAGAGSGVVVEDNGDHLIMHTYNGTTFVDNEVLTGGTSGTTANANGVQKNEDILVEATASSDTFTIPATANRMYVIPVDAEMLDVSGGFDCLQLDLADAGSSQTDGGALYVMSKPRYAAKVPQTAIYD
jgi:S-adenosylmethionine/arginine decarboxylase-like enzyme